MHKIMLFTKLILYYIIPLGVILLLLAAAFNDIALRIIPNSASIGLLMIGMALRLEDHWIIPSLVLTTLVFMAAVLCWSQRWMGGGDVKLLAATTLVVTPNQVGSLLLLIALCGGVLGVLYLTLSCTVRIASPGQPINALRRILRAERWRICRGAPLPYAVAIAFGGITLILTGL